uniref:Lipocalin n=1 Tax=Rhipicephalus zambeziensis TaxID=60191 RepID=A0A224YBE3_9ACAR
MVSFKMHFALTLAFGSCAYAIKYPPGWKASRLQDFQEMLDTGQKIWLTMITKEMRQIDCDYWVMIALNKTDYDFYHWYRKQPRGREWTKKGPQQKNERLHADLRYEGRRPAMFIRHYLEKESKAKAHKLLFWSTEEKCAVFELPEGDCEQRTWQSKLGQTYECDRVFFGLCGAFTYPVFKKSCISPNAICVGLTSLC